LRLNAAQVAGLTFVAFFVFCSLFSALRRLVVAMRCLPLLLLLLAACSAVLSNFAPVPSALGSPVRTFEFASGSSPLREFTSLTLSPRNSHSSFLAYSICTRQRHFLSSVNSARLRADDGFDLIFSVCSSVADCLQKSQTKNAHDLYCLEGVSLVDAVFSASSPLSVAVRNAQGGELAVFHSV
jgi:hypothetical protein